MFMFCIVFGHVFVSRRWSIWGAPVPVPEAAVFRPVWAAAVVVRGRQVLHEQPITLNTLSYCILILYAYKDFLATLYPLYISLGCILVSCARLLRYNTFWSFLIKLINVICILILRVALCVAWVAHFSLKLVLLETWFRGPARCLLPGWSLSIRTGS